MTKRDEQSMRSITTDNKRDSSIFVTREYVHSLRGKLKGKGLLKALMREKEKERTS